MSADYEKEMDATLSKLESEKRTLETQNGRLMQELENYREKQRERHEIAHSEIEKLKDLLNKETDERVCFNQKFLITICILISPDFLQIVTGPKNARKTNCLKNIQGPL